MNARVSTPRVVPPNLPRDLQLERETLGVALLGYPLPDWLEPRDFFASHHQLILRAIRDLGASASLPAVASLLREQGWLYTRAHGPDRHSKPGMLSSVDLAVMLEDANHTLTMGWAVEMERLRELADQRRILEACTRVQILLSHEGTAEAARVMLKEAM